MKRLLIIIITVTLMITSCTTGVNVVSDEDMKNGFPILEEYEELAAMERETDYEFNGLLKRSITKYFMDSLYMQVFSAMILSNMMSERTIMTALEIKENNNDVVKGLSSYNRKNIEHFTYVTERIDKDDPIQVWHSLLLSYLKFLNYDVMVSLAEKYGNTIGACCDISSMNVAFLRLFGVKPEDIVFLTIPEHAITSFSYKGEDYLADNAYFLRHVDNNIYEDTMGFFENVDYGQFQDYNKVTGICNDAFYVTGFTMEGRMTQSTYSNFIKRYNFKSKFSEDINFFQIDPNKEDFGNNIDYIKVTLDERISPKEIAKDIIKQVYTFSKDEPESQYTLAKYGYQTLLVKYPEFYIRENSKTELIKEYSRKYKTPDSMIEYIMNNISEGSIFFEVHRIMDPEQVIVTRRGGAKDKAILLQALMSNNEIPSYILLTDKKSYILFKEGEWKIFDTSAMSYSQEIEGELSLILNEKEIYYPLMQRNFLGDEIKSVLEKYSVEKISIVD